MGRASPLAVLKLCFGTDKYDFPDCLLQLADDLDFTQDTLNAAGESLVLNPVLNGVLAGFNRRRRYSRFKYGHHTLELDRLRFAHTVSEKDSDLFATEVKKNRKAGKSTGFTTLCTFFQRAGGCSQNNCLFSHKCSICSKPNHGAVDCFSRRQNGNRTKKRQDPKTREDTMQEPEKPPHPRFRRARADDI